MSTETGAMEVALLLCAVAVLMMPGRPRVDRKVRARRPPNPRHQPTRRAIAFAVAIAAVGVALFPGLWWAVLPVAVAVGVVLVRRPVGRSTAQRDHDRRLIAVHAELLASCLDAGMATGTALLAVSDVLTAVGSAGRSRQGPAPPARLGGGGQSGPLAPLDAVAAMLSLGADPETAWRVVDLDGDLAPLAAAALRSAAGGGGLAEAVREYAAQLRQDIAAGSVRAAGRAGVLMTAPLGVCFLPAFLCLGLAPVIVGLLSQLHIF